MSKDFSSEEISNSSQQLSSSSTMSRIFSISDLRFIKPTTLRKWFKQGSLTGTGKFAVVDVRDSDYVGGHIRGCLHYPSADFNNTLGELQDRLYEDQINDVVFHCALSQQRGPSASLKFLRSCNDVSDPSRSQHFKSMNVWVLEGGFTAWQAQYGDDTEVTEGYAKDLWEM